MFYFIKISRVYTNYSLKRAVYKVCRYPLHFLIHHYARVTHEFHEKRRQLIVYAFTQSSPSLKATPPKLKPYVVKCSRYEGHFFRVRLLPIIAFR